MYSIGGYGSVKGFEPSVAIGDSGYETSLEWKNSTFKNKTFNFTTGLFVDFATVFINTPQSGESSLFRLFGSGASANLIIDKKYSFNPYAGYPIDSTNVEYEKKYSSMQY